MTITFLGAAQEVTGSCFLVETGDARILIDCGLFQGERLSEAYNAADWQFDPATIDAVILTHAHLDHCGRLPKLAGRKFHGRIFATAPTLDLVPLILADAAKMLEREAKREHHSALYDQGDIDQVSRYCYAVDYHRTVTISADTSFTLLDAGHILGSASVELTVGGRRVIFSGDLGNSPAPIIPPTEVPEAADVLVIETTYGNRVHEDLHERRQMLRALIEKVCEQRGILLIPSFALERTQEILHEIDQLMRHQKIPSIPVFLDSPLAIAVTHVFTQHPEYFNSPTRLHMSRDSFLDFPSLVMTEKEEESRAIAQTPAPKVIIAGSGMMHGGRILRHAIRYLPDPENNLLIIGYQARGSLGRRLLEGERRIHINGKEVEVRAHVEAIGGYSAHADQRQLLSWVNRMQEKPIRAFLVHGEPDAQRDFAKQLKQQYGIESIAPELGSRWEV